MSGKVPPSSRAGRKRAASDDLRKAASVYERFTGHDPEIIGRVKLPPHPKAAAAIGYVDGIMYTTVRDDREEKYIHKFAKKDRPVMAVTPDGKQILLIGGRYKFTDRGIVDKSDVKNWRETR